jgi:dTDP-4-amino-4,6-dideoxy-D-galactose acyltransferase
MIVPVRKDWDSDFFGYEVWEINGEPGASELKEQLEEMKKQGIALVYVLSKNDLDLPGKEITLVDRKVLYGKKPGPAADPVTGIESYPAGSDYQELLPLALASGLYSRFHTDPHFQNREFERMYEEWIKHSVDRTIANEVLVCREGGQTLGMVTISKNGNSARIGLIAVAEGQRGKQIGSRLVQASEAFALENNCNYLDVYTQQDNRSACSFYEKNGFHIDAVTNIYHSWLNRG